MAMTLLYSFNQEWPKPIPFRITTKDGLTRTDPSTFSDELLLECGYTGPFTFPEYDSLTEAVDWTGTDFQVRPLTEEELQSLAIQKGQDLRTQRNASLASSDWTQLADAPVDSSAWAVYRQQLRDITKQPGFPSDLTWPVAPD